MTNNETLLQKLADSSLGKKLLGDDAKAREAERAKQLAELAAIRRQEEQETPALLAARDRARKKREEAQAALDKAVEAERKAAQALTGASTSWNHRAARLRNLLAASADPAFDAFIAEMRGADVAFCRNGRTETETTAPDLDGRTRVLASTRASQERWLDYIREACRLAEDLKTLPTDAGLAELAKLRELIPAIELEKL